MQFRMIALPFLTGYTRERNRKANWQRNRPSCSTLFTAPFRNRNLGWKCLKCQLCPGTSSRTSRPLWSLLPSFEPRLLFSSLCKLAGMKDTALSAYLHRKATAWYKWFPPIHSPDRAEDPKTPQVDGGDGAGGVARGRGGFRGSPRGVGVFIR